MKRKLLGTSKAKRGADLLLNRNPEPCFLGVTRFNWTKNGGEWDCAKHAHRFNPVITFVTHWAEIEGPSGAAQDEIYRPPQPTSIR